MESTYNNKKRVRFVLKGACVLLGCALTAAPALAQPAQGSASATLVDGYREYQNARYAVRWRVVPDQLDGLLQRMPRYQSLIFYTTENVLQSQSGRWVYLGFFKTQNEADRFAADNRSAFSGLQAVAVTPNEHKALFSIDPSDGVYWLGPSALDNRPEIQAIFSEAKTAYTNNEFQRSLQLYSILALSSDTEMRVWALELVGLNHERLGNRTAAKARYRDLLDRFPEGSWTHRVEQRLRALETAADDGKTALRSSKYPKERREVYWRGLIGQTYSHISQTGKYIPDRDALSVVTTHFDITAGTTYWQGHKIDTRLSGYDMMDLREVGDDAKTRIKRFNVDYTHIDTGFNLLAGRQRDKNAGVYGYFDGASVSYPLGDQFKIGAKGGVPVRFTDFYDTLDHKFASAFAEYRLNERWFFSAYTTQQTLYDEVDRAAYGGTVEYKGEKLSSSVNLDYDYEFAELNIFRWNGHLSIDDKSRLSATYSRQRNPFLSATNVLIGQPYLDLEVYLREELDHQYALYDALNRTSLYETGSLSYHYRVDEKLQYSVDAYHSVSSDVPVFESHDGWLTSDVSFKGVYRYSSVGIQAVALDFFGVDDTATMSFRHGDTTFATTNTLQFSERFRFGSKVHIRPKLGLRQSTNKETDSSQTYARVSLSGTYSPWKGTEFRLEAGNEAIQDLEGNNSVDNTFIYAGYQVRF